jgi:hypothetical protein
VPWESDLKRLVASFVVSARYLNFSEAPAKTAVRSAFASAAAWGAMLIARQVNL